MMQRQDARISTGFNAFVRIFNEVTGEEILRYDLEKISIETVVFGELYKNGGEWKFNAIGSGYQGGLAALCNSYGGRRAE